MYTSSMTTTLPADTKSKIIPVPWNLDGERLDGAAHEVSRGWFSPNLPRSFVQTAIKSNAILFNGVPASARTRVSKGDKLLFTEDFFQSIIRNEERLAPHPEEPALLVTTDAFIVLYKPAGWLTHEVSGYQSEASLEDWLLQKGLVNAEIPNNGRVHRLDRNTSGIILYAKTREAQEELKTLFRERHVTKTYVALAEGHIPELSGTINAPIIRKKGSFKRIIAENERVTGSKSAITDYRVILRTEAHDLIIVTPKTGRTHQIRVHMEHLGHPLAGDPLYGGKTTLIARQFLHAWSLQFTFGGQKYAFTAPLALDLKNLILSLDENSLTRYDNEALQSMGLKQQKGFFSFLKGIYLKFR